MRPDSREPVRGERLAHVLLLGLAHAGDREVHTRHSSLHRAGRGRLPWVGDGKTYFLDALYRRNALATDHLVHGKSEDFEIQPQAPVVHIPDIQLQPLAELEGVAP